MSRVAVTGLGVVAPGAIGIEAFREQLLAGRTAVAVVDRWDTSGLRSHRAALVRDFKPRDFIAPMKMRRMNTLSRLAVSAARMAIDDRGGELPQAGVAMGTVFGPVQTSVDYMSEYVEKGPALAPPQLFAESVANAPGSHIAIEWGLRGFNITVTQRESSALAAAMVACSQILKGSCGAAVIGGVDEATETTFTVLDRLGALAHATDGDDEAMRPLDRRRNGFALGEGSAVLIAERDAGPRPVYGYFSGFGIARDVTASISDWGDDPGALVSAMKAALDDAEVAPSEVSAIYASANSTVRADRLEYRAIQEMFGAAAPPVVATKGVFGEYSAGGAHQLAAAFLAVRDQVLHPSCGFSEGEAELRLDVVAQPRRADVKHILVNSVSAGGGIVCALLSREAA